MKKSVLIVLALVVAAAGIAIYFCIGARTEQTDFFAMDTYITVKAKGPGASEFTKKAQEITESLDKSVLSRHREGSEIFNINAMRGGRMSEKVLESVKTMLDVYRESGGKFDFTLGALSDLWDFTGGGTVPDKADIGRILTQCGADKIVLNGSEISFPEGIILDFGAVGKGIALDEIKKELKKSKVKEAVVSEGGSILLYGDREFSVGIQNPQGSGYVAVLNVDACCVSTSGSYERYFEAGGRRYHHILDPDTGYPCESGLVSVTVISDSGILSDALSTACFVLGEKDGMELALKYGCDAVFIDESGNITATDNIKDRIEITDENYKMK